jgi:hypothetical protein
VIILSSQLESGEENKQSKAYPFYKRFEIEIDLESAKQNFINRALNLVELQFPFLQAH